MKLTQVIEHYLYLGVKQNYKNPIYKWIFKIRLFAIFSLELVKNNSNLDESPSRIVTYKFYHQL
jgi:hypothetical protein